MEIDPQQFLKHLENQSRYKGEVENYWASMRKLPDYDYTRFYANYPEYKAVITQGDIIQNLQHIQLPNPDIQKSRCVIISNTCDADLENKRKFPSRLLYAPLLKLSAFEALLRNAVKSDGTKKYSKEQINTLLELIRKQKIGQIFYLPAGKQLSEEGMIFFDNICSFDNASISRNNLDSDRILSLSAYGWHIFLEKLGLFFTRLSDETVELRFNPS